MTSRPRSSGREWAAATPRHRSPSAPPRREPPLGDAARDAAFRLLARQAQVYPDFDLGAKDRLLNAQDARLSPLDAAFAHALCDACIRRWLTLELLLQRSLSEPFDSLEARMRAVLLAGAAQLLFMDKVPPHAAINHAVEWAKKAIRPGAGSLANAVLRRVALLVPDRHAALRDHFSDRDDELPLGDGRALALAEPIVPSDPIDRLRVTTSHPNPLLEHWLTSRPLDQVRSLCLHSLCDPPTIINARHARAPLPPDQFTPHSTPGHAVVRGPGSRLPQLLGARTDAWAQDPASSLAVESVADLRPGVIADLCAGRGTKTRQLAAAFPNARIVATDPDDPRRAALAAVFAGSAQVSVLPPRRAFETLLASADLVLLDVPCSNTGVLARRPEARYRFGPDTLASLVSVQKQIIADALPLLRERPRGRILYSTCSLEPQENLDQARWAQRWHRTPISRDRQTQPAGLPGGEPADYHDGSFSALLG